MAETPPEKRRVGAGGTASVGTGKTGAAATPRAKAQGTTAGKRTGMKTPKKSARGGNTGNSLLPASINLQTMIKLVLYVFAFGVLLLVHYGIGVGVKQQHLWSKYLFWWFPRPAPKIGGKGVQTDNEEVAAIEGQDSSAASPPVASQAAAAAADRSKPTQNMDKSLYTRRGSTTSRAGADAGGDVGVAH